MACSSAQIHGLGTPSFYRMAPPAPPKSSQGHGMNNARIRFFSILLALQDGAQPLISKRFIRHMEFEGYHVSVDGRHVTFFPHRTGFSLEDATGLSIKGDVDVLSIFAASLPTSHPSFAPQMHLELLPQGKAPPLLHMNVELFIGILSAGNHFAERMAVRKSWMQHKLIKSSNVVARFFVALLLVSLVSSFRYDKVVVNLEAAKEEASKLHEAINCKKLEQYLSEMDLDKWQPLPVSSLAEMTFLYMKLKLE